MAGRRRRAGPPTAHVSLAGALVVAVAVVAVAAWGGTRGASPTQAEEEHGDPWAFAGRLVGQMDATAIQVCTAEARSQAAVTPEEQERARVQLEQFVRAYEAEAAEYEKSIRDTALAGSPRPRGVPAVARPLAVTKSRVCLKPAALEIDPPPPPSPPGPPGRFLTLDQLDAAAAEAGWPMQAGWWPEMRRIVLCETRSLDSMATNPGDPNGGSFGLAQLNGRQHFDRAGEDFALRFDPVVNLRTALWLRSARGRFGGAGGWGACATALGVD